MTTREALYHPDHPWPAGLVEPRAFRSPTDLIEVPRKPGIPLDLGWVREHRRPGAPMSGAL